MDNVTFASWISGSHITNTYIHMCIYATHFNIILCAHTCGCITDEEIQSDAHVFVQVSRTFEQALLIIYWSWSRLENCKPYWKKKRERNSWGDLSRAHQADHTQCCSVEILAHYRHLIGFHPPMWWRCAQLCSHQTNSLSGEQKEHPCASYRAWRHYAPIFVRVESAEFSKTHREVHWSTISPHGTVRHQRRTFTKHFHLVPFHFDILIFIWGTFELMTNLM